MASLMLPIAKSLITARAEASRHRKTLQQPTPICHTKSGPQNRGQFCFTKRAGKVKANSRPSLFPACFSYAKTAPKTGPLFELATWIGPQHRALWPSLARRKNTARNRTYSQLPCCTVHECHPHSTANHAFATTHGKPCSVYVGTA